MKKTNSKKIIIAFTSLVFIWTLTLNVYAADVVQNRFYSIYTPTKFNYTGTPPADGATSFHVQYRMNCYGYAFSHIKYGSAQVFNRQGYKQQPGNFASTANIPNVKQNVTGDPVTSMTNVVYNFKLDASRLGYSATEYVPPNPTVGQAGTSSRMIAVVTGTSDYHFYMQHNDGTWSHKPGSSAVTNKSLSDNVSLTNANIKTKANQGMYTGGQLKFFVITKDAVMDYPHSSFNGTQCALNYSEKGGEYPVTSTNITTGTTSANMDFGKDQDVYGFTASSSKTYTITTTCTTGANLNCRLFDSQGTLLKSDYVSGQVNMTYSMTSGKKYYIEIYNSSENHTGYSISII